MQHTLIPLVDRKRLHREYYVRFVTVLLSILACSVIVGAGALFPAYIQAWLTRNNTESMFTMVKNLKREAGVDMANKQLSRDSILIQALSKDAQTVYFSDIVRSIISRKQDVVINSFNVSQGEGKKIAIAITGIAPTRDELLAFKGRLESLMPGTTIDVPISQLARSTNVPFSFQFIKILQ